MSDFRINYRKVISQANDIDDLASDLRREINKLDDLIDVVKQGWIGKASSTYQRKLSELIEDMKTTKTSMESVASSIKSTANRIREEDERLAEEAKKKL